MTPKAALAATLSCARSMIADDSGGTIIEYAIFMFLVTVAIGFLFPEIGALVNDLFMRTTLEMNTAVSGAQMR
jgi:Flp pilus assembly pilin Flp